MLPAGDVGPRSPPRNSWVCPQCQTWTWNDKSTCHYCFAGRPSHNRQGNTKAQQQLDQQAAEEKRLRAKKAKEVKRKGLLVEP